MQKLKEISQKDLAAKLGISQQAVSQWFKVGLVPARRVLEVSRITGIDPYHLNPKTHAEEKSL